MTGDTVPGSISDLVGSEIAKRRTLLRTAALISFRPTAFAARMPAADQDGLWPPLRFFVKVVGLVIAIETAFSIVFKTAFSDLIHHAFPILVALTGGVAIYVLLKLMWTRAATFTETLASALYTGSAALLVMITSIFALLTADFAANYDSVMASGCAHRTIMCLLSGNVQYDYAALGTGGTGETQGWSYTPILLVIFACILYFTHVLATLLKCRLGVARWRTSLAALFAVLLLSPVYLLVLNGIYRALYGAVTG